MKFRSDGDRSAPLIEFFKRRLWNWETWLRNDHLSACLTRMMQSRIVFKTFNKWLFVEWHSSWIDKKITHVDRTESTVINDIVRVYSTLCRSNWRSTDWPVDSQQDSMLLVCVNRPRTVSTHWWSTRTNNSMRIGSSVKELCSGSLSLKPTKPIDNCFWQLVIQRKLHKR